MGDQTAGRKQLDALLESEIEVLDSEVKLAPFLDRMEKQGKSHYRTIPFQDRKPTGGTTTPPAVRRFSCLGITRHVLAQNSDALFKFAIIASFHNYAKPDYARGYNSMSDELDAKFFRRFSWIILVLFMIGFTMVFLAGEFGAQVKDSTDDTLSNRMRPVGKVTVDPDAPSQAAETLKTTHRKVASTRVAAAGAVARSETPNPGKVIYDQACFACHATTALGAPVLGAKDAWTQRFEKGFEMLLSNVIEGYTGESGIMPPKGGFTYLTDQNVRDALIFMLQESGGEALVPTGNASTAGERGAATAPDAITELSATTALVEQITSIDPTEDLVKGEEVYDSACFICHTPGAAGAPKHGDAKSWAGRNEQDLAVLHDHAINGYMGKSGLMPPKGGRVDLSDDDVKAAVAYMLDAIK